MIYTKRYTGVISLYSITRGFGFIIPDDLKSTDGAEIFYHFSKIKTDIDIVKLTKGTRVEYQMYKTEKGYRAINIIFLN